MTVADLIKKEKELLIKQHEAELEEIERESEKGSWGNSEWLCGRLDGKTFRWIQEFILYPFRDELEGEIVFYGSRGKPYIFNKYRMNIWLDENFGRVVGRMK